MWKLMTSPTGAQVYIYSQEGDSHIPRILWLRKPHMIVALTAHRINIVVATGEVYITSKQQFEQNIQPSTYLTFLINIS